MVTASLHTITAPTRCERLAATGVVGPAFDVLIARRTKHDDSTTTGLQRPEPLNNEPPARGRIRSSVCQGRPGLGSPPVLVVVPG